MTTICWQQVLWVTGFTDTVFYVEKNILYFKGKICFIVASWPSLPLCYYWSRLDIQASIWVSQFVCHLQHSDFVFKEQMFCVWPCLKPLWSIKGSLNGHLVENPQHFLKDIIIVCTFFLYLNKAIWSLITEILKSKVGGVGWGGWSRSHI